MPRRDGPQDFILRARSVPCGGRAAPWVAGLLALSLGACASDPSSGMPCRDGGWGGGWRCDDGPVSAPRPRAPGVPPVSEDLRERNAPGRAERREREAAYQALGYPDDVARDLAKRDIERRD